MGRLRDPSRVHRSPRQGSVWREERNGTVTWRGRQTEKGKTTVRAAISVPRGLTGRPLKQALDKAEADCRLLLARRILERDAGTMRPIDRERATLRAYAEIWLAEAEHSDRRESTVDVYHRLLEQHVLDHLGDVRIRDLRREHIVRWWSKVPTDSTRSQAHAVLIAVLTQAAADDYPVAATVLLVGRPRYEVPEQPRLTGAQLHRLLNASQEPYRTLWLLIWATTARISEALGFVWADVDEIGGSLRLTHQLARDGQERVPLKHKRQRRQIALGRDTFRALRAHRQREITAGAGQAGDWLFWREGRDGPLHYGAARKEYKAALKRAQLPETLRLHSIRHGAAQALIDEGTDLDTVSRRLGHATVLQTSETYLRQSTRADRLAARRADRALRNTPQDVPKQAGESA